MQQNSRGADLSCTVHNKSNGILNWSNDSSNRKKQPSSQKETSKYKSEREKEIQLVPCEFITHKQSHLQAGAGTTAGHSWGRVKARGAEPSWCTAVYENTWIWKPHPSVQHSSPFTAYQGCFNKHVFYGVPSTLLLVEIPGCIPFPQHFTMLFHCCVWPLAKPQKL